MVERHRVINSWRRGFMRCRGREGPWGSHQDEASALKWETSVGSTVELDVGLWYFGVVVVILRDAVGESIRRGTSLADARCCGERET